MTTKSTALTAKQRAVLDAAARSANLVATPLPKGLKLSPGSAAIVVRGLLRKGLLEKRPALGSDAVWREEAGTRYTLVITRAGLAAVGLSRPERLTEKADDAAKSGPTAAVSEGQRRMPRAGSKLAILLALLRRDEGATVDEMAEATGWQPHTVRGVMSGALARRFGVTTVSEKIEGRGRVYRAG